MWSLKLLLVSLVSLSHVILAQSSNSSYTAPTSKGFRMKHGFETVLVQPFGNDGFRVRAWPFKPPRGDEISFLYDPPLEGYDSDQAHGMSFDTTSIGNSSTTLRNGNIVMRTIGGTYQKNTSLAFYRVEDDGSESLLLNEYSPVKSKNPRYYEWNGPGSEFYAEFSWTSDPNEQIYGTGQQQDHMINKKGQTIDLLNFNSYIPTPMFMSSRGYGFVWNSAAEGRMEFSPFRTRITSEATSVVDYAIVTAPKGNYDEIQQKLSAITGRAPTPPDWSLGYLHSKLRYENQTEVLLLADNFKKYDIPVSLIVIDYQSWAHQGDWGLDPGLWPNVSYMAQQVKEITGAEMMASLWPSVEDASENYLYMQANGLLATTRSGPGTTDSWNGSYIRNYDATNPEARKFLWDTLKRNYYDKGIKNFWIDQADGGALGEAWENNGQDSYIESIPYPLPDVLYHTGTQKSTGKLYPWAHQQAIEEGQRNATDSKEGDACETVSLSRSGYIGSQRFCSMIWSGDTTAVWDTLALQVAAGLSMAATGMSWWTLDAGGFQSDPDVPWSNNIDEPQYRELYVRWQQWSTFLPFMRNHGARKCNVQHAFRCDNEPWTYGANNTPTIKSYIELRYSLKNYIKAVFDQFSKSGRMIMRPLYMDFETTDENISDMVKANKNATTQQYMFGPRLLVTPVTLPGKMEWDVYLPKTSASAGNGTKPWTYWWTNQTYAGGQTVTVPAPLEHIPVFYLGSSNDIMSGSVF